MSEGDVSLIRDEDVLRRMWQQTEDFSRKKEIRAHMYRLREERLRSLYSPEPGAEGKGCEFSSTQGHVKSFADQSFQSMKSKEVRDAGSPPKEFTYRGQDLKELSNAGWNVESENRTTDDGHTRVKSVQANIEGKYDVEGGRGQFAAFDQHKQAVTEYDDGNTSLKRNESSANTAAHEQVVRKTDDGTQISSTTSSSSSTSKLQKYSSTNEAVPYLTSNDYDTSRQKIEDTNRNEEVIVRKTTQASEYEQNLRSDYEHGEVVSRKVEYPDNNTKVVVETRRLPDGTKITSTRREFRAPVVQSSRSEQHSQQTKTENKSSYTSKQQRSHINESSSKTYRDTVDNNTHNIVDTQRVMDDFDFNKNRHTDKTENRNEQYMQSTQFHTTNNQKHENNNNVRNQEVISSYEDKNIDRKIKETHINKDNEERIHKVIRDNKQEETIERKISSDQYQTTYQADFTQKKISNDWSPSHQAWASSLRSDTPTRPSTRASSPGSKTFKSSNSSLRSSVSPDKTYKKPPSRGGSPNKVDRYSPTRTFSDRHSSNHSNQSVTEKTNSYTSKEIRQTQTRSPIRPSTSPDRKSRPSISPEKRMHSPSDESRIGFDREPHRNEYTGNQSREGSPTKTRDYPSDRSTPTRSSPSRPRSDRSSPEKMSPSVSNKTVSPTRLSKSPDRKAGFTTTENILLDKELPQDSSPSNKLSPKTTPVDKNYPIETDDKTPGYMRSTASSKPKSSDIPTSPFKGNKPDDKLPGKTKTDKSPERKPHESAVTKVQKEHYKFIDEETKMYTRSDEQQSEITSEISSTHKVFKRPTDDSINIKPDSKTPPTLVKQSPSPDSPDDNEHATGLDFHDLDSSIVDSPKRNISPSPDKYQSRKGETPTRTSPSKDVPSDEKPLIDEGITKKGDKSSPSRDSSPTKDRPGSRTTSPRSSLRKKSLSPEKHSIHVTSFKQTSEKVTATSNVSESTKISSRKSSQSPEKFPHKERSPTKRAPTENLPSSPIDKRPVKFNSPPKETSPIRKTPVQDTMKHIVKESSKNVQEIKEYSDTTRREPVKMTTKSSPARKSPTKDMPDFARTENVNKSLPSSRNTSRSPSPIKGQIRDTRYDTYIKTEKSDQRTTENSKDSVKNEHRHTTVSSSFKDSPSRETSPSKNGNYSQQQQDHHKSPARQPGSSISSTKMQTQDVKKQVTTEFLDVERTVEEINKNTVTKERPKQLVTPSTSPTRKPKGVETEPSTGQSSPTTSVSGFVYFSSPSPNKDIITDLDDDNLDINMDGIDIKNKPDQDVKSIRSKSPSKIPCRSPSPEKRPVKDNLPRKSSLKKPSVDNSQVSPTEKPPSSFSVSPMVESKEFQPDSKEESTPKSTPKAKPPLERRETYEERCRKILGMSEDTNNESSTVTSEDKLICQHSEANSSSPSVSPCRSPTPEVSTSKDSHRNVKTTLTDFLEKERVSDSNTDQVPKEDKTPHELLSETTPMKRKNEPMENKSKFSQTSSSPSNHVHRNNKNIETNLKSHEKSTRDSSPTKLKDIISNTKHNIEVKSEESRVTEVFQYDTESFKQTITNKINKDVSRQSPERKPNDLTTSKRPYSTFNQTQENNTISMKPYDNNPTVIQPANIKPLTEYDLTTNIIETEKSNTEKQKVSANSDKISKQNLSGNTPVTSSTGNKKEPVGKHLKETSPLRSLRNSSLEKRNNTPKTNTAITSTEHNLSQTTENIQNVTQVMEDEFTTPRSSPTRTIPDISTTRREETRDTNFSNIKTDFNSDLISSEREQEVLDRVNKSLRKLSPDRKNRSPNREKSPEKLSTTSTNTIKVISQAKTVSVQKVETDKDVEITRNNVINKSDINKSDKQKDSRVSSKPPSRNVSPVKKNNNTSSKPESPDSAAKTRSISPKKPTTPIDRPQSPQIQKNNNPKSRDSIPSHIRKPSPSPTSPTRTDKLMEKVSIDSRKTISAIKHNSFTRIANKVTPKGSSNTVFKTTEQDSKQQTTPKGINKENIHPKKDSDIKVMRTSSDIALKTKKIPSQRMKSKPEIQVSDMSTTKQVKQSASTMKGQKSQPKESPINFPTSKPKSATALNTSTEDDDDILIDVQQAKSSRENSPDRICPTPVGFLEDVGTPRFPDEVNEPDDDFNKRAYHIIHESESIVDDIVEICEDDELFVRQTDFDETDKYLLKVNEKLPKYGNKSETPNRTKESITRFKDVESKVHSDFNVDNIKSDECLLSVSEKVTKFAKGPRETKDKSPSRNIVDEYDKNTIYQDDYTKLSVNDKAHLFVETAENVKLSKPKPVQKIERPDFSDIDDSLKSDDCLLSVSDKVNKFVKTAEQFLSETQEVEEKDKKIKEEHDRIMKKIVNCPDEQTNVTKCQMDSINTDKYSKHSDEQSKKEPKVKETTTTQIKNKDNVNHNLKPTDRNAPVKITTLRSSEAVKKAKALFENIASTTQKTKDVTHTKTTKLTDIGVIKKTSKFDSGPNVRPSLEDDIVTSSNPETEKSHALPETVSKDLPSKTTVNQRQQAVRDSNETVGSSPGQLTAHSPDISRTKSPLRQVTETATTTTKTILSRYPTTERAESPKHVRSEPEKPDKPHEKVPGYLRATKTSQKREEKTAEVTDTEVSSRRGSGKFGVELRRTSVERSTVSSERRRSVEHHQPCIEDIFDLDLLEQMLEKVVGYEQRRRIRAQIRIAKKRFETEQVDTISTTHTRTSKLTTKVAKAKSPDRPAQRSPERHAKPPHKTFSPDRQSKSTPQKISSADHHSKAQRPSPDRMEPKEPTKPILNGHGKETSKTSPEKRQRPHSPEKPSLRSTPKSPVRQPSPEKKSRPLSPMKTATPKSKANRFNEYATAYMKKVGLESDKLKVSDAKIKKITEDKNRRIAEHRSVESRQSTTVTKSVSERTTSKDTIEIAQLNGKRSPSPETKRSPERKPQSSERIVHSPERKPQSPDRKAQSPERKASPERVLQSPHPKARSPERKPQSPERIATPETRRVKDSVSKEVIVTTVDDVEKKLPQKQRQDEKPSWVTNRNLKKITSETRTFSTKKMESEKPKYRAPSPSKVISKPLDVITSSYGPGPLDADGRPLFGIKALRNGATNFQVKGTVVRQEFHSRNGGAPEGTVSVTAYSTEPEQLERLLRSQGERPSRLHGLAAITTTRKFGGDTGTTLSEAHNREERAALDQFTHSERRTSGGADCRAAHAPVQRERVEILDVSDLDRRHSQADRSDRRQETTEDRSEADRRQETTRRVERTDDRKQESRREEERRKEKMEKSEKSERIERREDRKTVRQSSVKSLTEKFIKSASESKTERSAYPKAGLILRSTALKDSVSSDSSAHQGLTRTDSEHSLGSVEDAVVTTSSEQSGRTTVTTTTRHHQPAGKQERSFLDSTTKVTGVQDILTRMKNADIVIEQGDSSADAEARALLNKFLGASVLMAGMQGYVCEREDRVVIADQESAQGGVKTGGRRAQPVDIDQCWDERVLRRLLDECSDYEQRRRLRARIRTLMAEQEACASAVTEALAGAGEGEAEGENEAGDAREEAEVTTTVTSSVRRNSSEKTVSSTTTTTTIKNSKVIESMLQPAPKPVSPFAKFRQLEKQNSTTNPSSPKTPQSPGSPSQPYFKFTDPALQASAVTIKERLLQWCRDKTRDYENVKLENFSTSWADGLAFCALLHHFLPAAFDYGALDAANRRHNFTLAFRIADEKAGIYPLLDVEDMVAMRKPDWKCVFTYVQSIYRRFKDQP